MAFKRMVFPEAFAFDELTSCLAGIGFALAATPNYQANIEDSLLFASEDGLERDDLRTLSILVTWLSQYMAMVNADRLIRVVQGQSSKRVKAFWSAVARWQSKDVRLRRLQKVYSGRHMDLLFSGTAFHIERKGEDQRFAKSCLRVPKGVLRDRPGDVFPPQELLRVNRTFRYRVLLGPTYRADMWALLAENPTLSVSDLARRSYGSFATAWQVKREHTLLAEVGTSLP